LFRPRRGDTFNFVAITSGKAWLKKKPIKLGIFLLLFGRPVLALESQCKGSAVSLARELVGKDKTVE